MSQFKTILKSEAIMKKSKFKPQFLVDETGKTTAVLLDVNAYEALLEELEDAHDIKRAQKIMSKKPKFHSLEDVEKSIASKSKR